MRMCSQGLVGCVLAGASEDVLAEIGRVCGGRG